VVVLSASQGSMVLLAGTLCSSWVAANRGTSKRSFLNPMGDLTAPSVRAGNAMVSRTLGIKGFVMLSSHSYDYGVECRMISRLAGQREGEGQAAGAQLCFQDLCHSHVNA
jgi:hypothetical protein